MLVALLLVVIWAAVLVPPAVQAHQDRQEAFLDSLADGTVPRAPSRSRQVQRRRRVAGGLVVATVATLVVGLLPTFRILLVVHLFLLDSLLGYLAVLAHLANQGAAAHAKALEAEEQVEPERVVDVVPTRPAIPRPVAVAPAG